MAAAEPHPAARVESDALHTTDGGHRGGAATEPGYELVDLVEGQDPVWMTRGNVGHVMRRRFPEIRERRTDRRRRAGKFAKDLAPLAQPHGAYFIGGSEVDLP